MNLLALDPAMSTGWAATGRQWGVQQFYKRPWRHPHAHYLDYRGWLLSKIDELRPDGLASEGAFSFSNRGGNDTRMQWEGITLLVAAECDLPLVVVMPSTLKKYATGYGRSERPEMRTALLERFGLDLAEEEHDAIAAIWVLSWAQREAEEGRLVREWSGAPTRCAGRGSICNTCQHVWEGGLRCPRCRGERVRLEA